MYGNKNASLIQLYSSLFRSKYGNNVGRDRGDKNCRRGTIHNLESFERLNRSYW